MDGGSGTLQQSSRKEKENHFILEKDLREAGIDYTKISILA